MHVNVRHKQQQQRHQRELTTVATTTTAAATTTTTEVRSTFAVNFQRHRKCFLQQTNENMKSFYAHTGNYLGTACCHFPCACNNIWPKLLPTAAGKKVLATHYSLGVQQKTHSAQAN